MTDASSPRVSTGCRSGYRAHDLGVATLLYVVLTVVLTWPAAPRLTQEVAGLPARDNLQYTWLLWWQGTAWRQGLGAGDNLLNYPWNEPHPLLDVTPELEALAYPWQRWLTPTASYNAILLLSFVFCGLAMYLLALDLTSKPTAALWGGVIFAFAAHRMGHALAGHLTQMALWWGPLYMRHLLRLFERPRWRDALWAGLFLALQSLIALVVTAYYALPLAGLSIAYLAWQRRRRLTRHHLWHIGGSLLVALVLVLPKLGPFAMDALRQGSDWRVTGATPNAVDLVALALPTPFHPLVGGALRSLDPLRQVFAGPSDLEHTAYLGWIALALAGLAVYRRSPGRGLWLWLGGAALALALGPTLQIGGVATSIPMPYALVEKLPFFSWGRTPERFLSVTTFALALLAAQGFATWHWPGALKGLLIVLAMVEMTVLWPWPAGTGAAPADVTAWRNESGAVMQLPATKRQVSNLAMYYQTAHQRPIVGGYIHRELPGMREYAKALEAVCVARGEGASRDPTPHELRRLLIGLDIHHVLVYREWVSEEWFLGTKARMIEAWGQPVADWESAIVFAAPPDSAPQDELARWRDVSLVDVRITPLPASPGDAVRVETLWRALQQPASDGTLFVHALDDHGQRFAQQDGPPLGGNWPTRRWAPGTTVLDEREMEIPGDLASGRYALGIGWYDATTMQGWPIQEADSTDGNMVVLAAMLWVE